MTKINVIRFQMMQDLIRTSLQKNIRKLYESNKNFDSWFAWVIL